MVGMYLIECVSGKGALPSASLPSSCMKMSDVMSMLCIAGDRLQTSSQKRFYVAIICNVPDNNNNLLFVSVRTS